PRACGCPSKLKRNHEHPADPPDTADADFDTDDTAIDVPATGSRVPRRPRLRRPTSKTTAVGAAILLLCASLALTGFFVWSDRVASQKHQRSAEFAAAARQDVM